METTREILRENSQAWLPKKDIKDQEILQINNLYLLYQSEKGLVIIDQHAAHERILYEQYLDEYYQKKNFQKLKLEKKIKINLTTASKALLNNYQEKFRELAFIFEEKNKEIYLTAIPKILKGRTDLREIIEETLEKLEEDNSPNLIDELTLRMIFYISCRYAIKANEYLTLKERQNLIKKLAKCKNPYTCPHGRPTQIIIAHRNLEKLFHRI